MATEVVRGELCSALVDSLPSTALEVVFEIYIERGVRALSTAWHARRWLLEQFGVLRGSPEFCLAARHAARRLVLPRYRKVAGMRVYERPAIEDAPNPLRLNVGSMTFVAGMAGSGKTTTVRLLAAAYARALLSLQSTGERAADASTGHGTQASVHVAHLAGAPSAQFLHANMAAAAQRERLAVLYTCESIVLREQEQDTTITHMADMARKGVMHCLFALRIPSTARTAWHVSKAADRIVVTLGKDPHTHGRTELAQQASALLGFDPTVLGRVFAEMPVYATLTFERDPAYDRGAPLCAANVLMFA